MATHLVGMAGTGHMGGALARGICRTVSGEKVMLSDRTLSKTEALALELGCASCTVAQVAKYCHYIFLGVKPPALKELFSELAPFLAARRSDTFVLVSMAAGVTMEQITEMAGADYPVIRIMPNLAVSVGAGVVLYDANRQVADAELQGFLDAVAGCGTVDRLPEGLMDAASAVTGCGPAFIAQVVEALSDGGVACGLPRDKALLYAEQMAEGTAKLLRETGQHPGLLKDAVCSPGGSTIEGVRVLERRGLRSAVTDAVVACVQRTAQLGTPSGGQREGL